MLAIVVPQLKVLMFFIGGGVLAGGVKDKAVLQRCTEEDLVDDIYAGDSNAVAFGEQMRNSVFLSMFDKNLYLNDEKDYAAIQCVCFCFAENKTMLPVNVVLRLMRKKRAKMKIGARLKRKKIIKKKLIISNTKANLLVIMSMLHYFEVIIAACSV